MKILVPVEGENRKVFTRIGQAPFFAIYENGDFLELRENLHAKSHQEEGTGHHHGKDQGEGQRHGGGKPHTEPYSKEEVEHHRRDLGNISDVDLVLTRAVGPNMKEALELQGHKVVKIRKADGETSDEVVENYLNKQQ
ncbi:NifB/NifX family molybdenum-iron cluster-binding protein [Nitratifractor salsuginis]|uniref:Dinitrogenase iron-molybdenum cofactor n=1 Tax=Nitratifractor salsuginis (strain DSM 16511 / JCM 12458 / E9I37-1) TaxID=749222 RepID=E6X207_NITSE|nr:NifB/NifX family molybdenum-iron cluster-binding protein [Nitratifractor salsuginis]ADV47076.1 putative dinitrogenase iron-molybdenum cofactor [Nitratifractor salsuginis DSM 16511]